MNKKEFVEIMGAMVEMYPGRFEKLGDLAIEMWFECLSDLECGIARQAIVNHAKSSKFPPTVADIREQYRFLREEVHKKAVAIENVFLSMTNFYPSGSYDKDAFGIFYSKIKNSESGLELEYAKTIRDAVIDYVKRCENGEEEFNMSLSECIRWACGEKVEEEE